MVKEGGPDVVEMTQQGEETAAELIIPHLTHRHTPQKSVRAAFDRIINH